MQSSTDRPATRPKPCCITELSLPATLSRRYPEAFLPALRAPEVHQDFLLAAYKRHYKTQYKF